MRSRVYSNRGQRRVRFPLIAWRPDARMAQVLLPPKMLNDQPTFLRSILMSGKTDELKGRIKEAAGAVADDDRLRREGKTDQATGKIKQNVEKVVDKAKDSIERLNDRTGKVGWAVLWLLGVPLPILLVLYLLMGR